MLDNKHNFQICAAKYLASKVLSYKNWLDSISDGRKGGVLALYGLCLLFSNHAVVHLHNNLVWSTLASLSNNHLEDIQKCDIHLCYLGRGLFMELVQHDIPLQILDDKPNVQSLVIGELSMEEESTYKSISLSRLGSAVNHPMKVTVGNQKAVVATTNYCMPAVTGTLQTYTKYASGSSLPGTPDIVGPKPKPNLRPDIKLSYTVRICLENMKIEDTTHRFKVTQDLLDKLPKSKYRTENYLDLLSSTYAATASNEHDSDATLLYLSSDETIQYWPLDDEHNVVMPSRYTVQDTIDSSSERKETGTHKKLLSKSQFNISLHGIRKHQHQYYFKCAEGNCHKSFSRIHDWNTHHRIFHKNKLKCANCDLRFLTPSAHRAHKNYHAPHKYTCPVCDKSFAFQSGLKQHKTVHSHS